MNCPGSIFSETVAVDEPVDLLRAIRCSGAAPLFYWKRPDRGLTIAAAGAVAEFRASGAGRFRDVSERARELLRSLIPGRNSDPGGGPLMVGGFGFSDRACEAYEWREFPPAWIFLPRLLWVRRGARCTLTTAWAKDDRDSADRLLARALEAPHSCHRSATAPPFLELRPSTTLLERQDWRERVERVRSQILCGALKKVVLSRRLTIETTSPIDPARFMDSARGTRPSCVNFFVSPRTTSFVGSTPEQLVKLDGQTVTSGALAGSMPRGNNHQADRALGDSLLSSAKNLEEHQYVVNALASALEPVASPLNVPARPRLMLLPEAQHLFTRVEGRLRKSRSVIELAGLLHPTPAVCGVPREAARAIIEREEPERGWYTGAIGWSDLRGQDGFAVALRAGVIDGSRMYLFGGAGIVAGSESEAEFAETENKLTALLGSTALG
jgi:menaquinone-specific isochorismate synthase